MEIKRGDVIYLKNAIPIGQYIQCNRRPYVVVSNNTGNKHSKICLCIPLTKQLKKLAQPTHTIIDFGNSMCLCEQIFTICQDDVERVVFQLSNNELRKIERCLKIALGMGDRA